jgi:hypothetical protein
MAKAMTEPYLHSILSRHVEHHDVLVDAETRKQEQTFVWTYSCRIDKREQGNCSLDFHP